MKVFGEFLTKREVLGEVGTTILLCAITVIGLALSLDVLLLITSMSFLCGALGSRVAKGIAIQPASLCYQFFVLGAWELGVFLTLILVSVYCSYHVDKFALEGSVGAAVLLIIAKLWILGVLLDVFIALAVYRLKYGETAPDEDRAVLESRTTVVDDIIDEISGIAKRLQAAAAAARSDRDRVLLRQELARGIALGRLASDLENLAALEGQVDDARLIPEVRASLQALLACLPRDVAPRIQEDLRTLLARDHLSIKAAGANIYALTKVLSLGGSA